MLTIEETSFFRAAFRALTGNYPFDWQVRLYERLRDRDIPPACDIPTGLGKTAIIPIWLIALAESGEGKGPRLPRRLVYVVNRRTVVDQATATVERMRNRLPDGKEYGRLDTECQRTMDELGRRPRQINTFAPF